MAENKRVRLEPHIEDYLKTHAQRVLGKSGDKLSAADFTTLTNSLLYEHKLTYSVVRQVSFAKLLGWVTSWMPNTSKVLQISRPSPDLTPKIEPENYEFDADLGDLYEEAA